LSEDEQFLRNLHIVEIPTLADMIRIAQLMGAFFKSGKQATKHMMNWPDGHGVLLTDMLTLEGTFGLFNSWRVYAALTMTPYASGPSFIATVEGISVEGRNPVAVMWAAAVRAKVRPHAFVGFAATKPLSNPEFRLTSGSEPERLSEQVDTGEPVGAEADPASGVQQEELPAGENPDQRAVDLDGDLPVMRRIAQKLAGEMQCNCDLDNWKPEPNTGHSHVCRIHKATIAEAQKQRAAKE
jgi:hypothetical protein